MRKPKSAIEYLESIGITTKQLKDVRFVARKIKFYKDRLDIAMNTLDYIANDTKERQVKRLKAIKSMMFKIGDLSAIELIDVESRARESINKIKGLSKRNGRKS